MKSLRLTTTTLCASAALALSSLSALANDPPAHSTKTPMDHSTMDMKGMKKTGDADYDFAMGMRHHHHLGVDMAKHELKDGKNAEMRQMAQKIVDAQKEEIARLDAWLAKNKPASMGSKK